MTELDDLLKRMKVLSSEFPQLTHTFNFMLGAVYSLREACGRDHRSRYTYDETDRPKHLRRLHEAIDAVAVGALPEPGWIAGFFYNAAIMRIDSCYERFLKAIIKAAGAKLKEPTKSESAIDVWAKQLEDELNLDPKLTRQHLKSVRDEVNNLKHKLYGHQPSKIMVREEKNDLINATAALNDLVALMERSEIRPLFAYKFANLPPP